MPRGLISGDLKKKKKKTCSSCHSFCQHEKWRLKERGFASSKTFLFLQVFIKHTHTHTRILVEANSGRSIRKCCKVRKMYLVLKSELMRRGNMWAPGLDELPRRHGRSEDPLTGVRASPGNPCRCRGGHSSFTHFLQRPNLL